jgi:hypothetical protein
VNGNSQDQFCRFQKKQGSAKIHQTLAAPVVIFSVNQGFSDWHAQVC